MDDKKEKLKAALLEFAGTLGLGTKDSRTKYKKTIIENFTEAPSSDNNQPIIEQTNVPAVSKELFTDYLDEIESIFGGETEKKAPGVISEEVERYVNERVSEVSSRLQQSMLGGTGGGTVSQQYKEGGTMEGNLHVMGRKKGLEYISPDAVSILTNPALQVNQHSTGAESIAQFYDDSTLKIDIDSVGNTTIYENLSVIKNVNIEGNLNVVGTSVISGGNITLGDDATTDNIVFYADVNSHIEPNTDGDFDLGSDTQKWRTLFVDNISAFGNIQLGDGAGDGIVYYGRVNSDILPSLNLTHKLGGSSNKWAEVHSGKIITSSTQSTNLTATNSVLTNATVTNLTGINIYTGTNATVTNLTGSSFAGTNATVTNLTVINTLSGTNATITNLTGSSFAGTNATVTNLTGVNTYTGTNSTVTNLTATNATVTNLTATNATATNLTATNATVTNLTGVNTYTGTNSTVTNLTGTNVVVVSGGIPSTVTDTGTTGTFKFDASHLYICISANGWKRVALSGF